MGDGPASKMAEPALECFWMVPLLRTFATDSIVGASMLGADSPLTPELVERFLALQALHEWIMK